VDSALLARRPDLRAAQARIQAAMDRRAAAKADLLPRVLLTGLAGRQGTSVSGLSLGAGNFFGVGPQLVLPVFTGGRLRAQVEAAGARLEQARLEYERELLAAFLEAEDAVAGYRAQCARLAELERAHRAASTAMELAAELYRAGAGDYLSVLEAQKTVFDLELALAEASGAAAVQSALLYKALAGGWPQ
jgi:outer membrane protein TolC